MKISKILILKRNQLVWYVVLSKKQQMLLAQVRKYTLKITKVSQFYGI